MKVLDLLGLVTFASPDLWPPSATFRERLPPLFLWFSSPLIEQFPNIPSARQTLHSFIFRIVSSVLSDFFPVPSVKIAF
jgi:hypothetical protein